MWNEFIKQFITLKGYENVLNGVWVTLQIAIFGLLIGILIGTLIAVVRVMPKYKLLYAYRWKNRGYRSAERQVRYKFRLRLRR